MTSVGVIGLGHVGDKVVRRLAEIPEIDTFYLFTSNHNAAVKLELDLGAASFEDVLGGENKIINLFEKQYNDIHKNIDDIDLMILTSSQSPYRKTKLKREDEYSWNVEIIKRMGYELQGFDKSVIVVTNPVDINAYLLSSLSGIPPELITGFNHIDLSRWRKIVRDIFLMHGLEPEASDHIHVITVGPHTEEAVALCSLGGLHIEDFTFLNPPNFDLLRKEFIQYPIRQFENGLKEGTVTEELTAYSLREVVKALLYGKRTVCQSTFMQPEELGIKGKLSGLFIGYPVQYDKSGRAIPQLEAVKNLLDNQSDINAIENAYHNLENFLMQKQKEKDFEKNPQRLVQPVFPEKQAPHKQTRPAPDYFGLEAKIIASADDMLYTWDDLRSPNKRDDIKLPFRIEALESLDINGENYLLLGKEGGISISTLAGKEQDNLKCDPDAKIRRIAVGELKGNKYVLAASQNKVYLFDPAKSSKPINEFEGFSGGINNISANGNEFLVSAHRLYLHNLENPEDSTHEFNLEEITGQRIDRQGISDAHTIGRDIIASIGATVIKFDRSNPKLTIDGRGITVSGINSLMPTPYRGGTIFIAAGEPRIYRLDIGRFEIDPEPYRKSDNNPYGTGRIRYVEQGLNSYIIAADKPEFDPSAASISLWNLLMPELRRFFPLNSDHRIRGLVVIPGK